MTLFKSAENCLDFHFHQPQVWGRMRRQAAKVLSEPTDNCAVSEDSRALQADVWVPDPIDFCNRSFPPKLIVLSPVNTYAQGKREPCIVFQ